MYRLIVVDDEELIRQGLLARLAYLGFTFTEIYEAASGIEALELIQEHPVDIVITDIQMPDMDGLTFIEKAKEYYQNLKFVLLTGYAEFAYAEKAISLGVKAYLLKPVSNSELKESLEKVYASIEEDAKLKIIVSSSNKLKKEKTDYLLEREINELVTNPEVEVSERYPFLLEVYPYAVGRRSCALFFGIINIDVESYDNGSFTKQDGELLRFSIRNVFYDIPSSCQKVIVNNLVNTHELYVFFAMERKGILRDEVEHIFLKLQSLFEKKMNVILTFGVSGCRDSLTSEGRREAKEALNQRLLHGPGNIFFYEDMKFLEGQYFPTAELTMLDHYMERIDVDNIRKTVAKIFSEDQTVKYGANYIRIMWVRILNMVLHRFNSGGTENDKTEQILAGFSLIDEVSSIKELAQKLDGIIISCLDEEGVKDSNAKNKITLAITYMEENYSQNIVINELAERYGMSPNYFSSMFKKETNQSAVNYLTTIRINKAVEYLQNTDFSVAEIARRVGYEDSQYFFRVFKKATGFTPLMYRKDKKSE